MVEQAAKPKGRLTQLADFVVKIAALAGATFAALEYRAAIDRDRHERTIRYIDRFETGEIGAAVRAISKEIRELAAREDIAEVRDHVVATPAVASESRALVAILLAYDSRNGEGLVDELDQVVSYFNSLQVCLEQNLCDAKVAHSFLDEYSENFWTNFEPYVAERRRDFASYGAAYERFHNSVSPVMSGGDK